MNRPVCIIVALALALGGAACFVPPEYVDSAVEWSGLGAVSGPLDMVVAVYESDNQPVAEVSVLGGNTANALRKVGKWRQYDQNKLPAKLEPVLSPIVAKLGVPCVVMVRANKVAASAELPATDPDLAALVAKKGGF